MEQQKPKFKFSYIIVLLLLVLMAVMIFGNNGYQGQLLGGGESDVYEKMLAIVNDLKSLNT